jgi:aarF domain-containing kinase
MFCKEIAFLARASGLRASRPVTVLLRESFVFPAKAIPVTPARITNSRFIATFRPANESGNSYAGFYTKNNHNYRNSSGSNGSHYWNASTVKALYASATAVATLSLTSDIASSPSNKHVLSPVDDSETREQGLYLASQEEKKLSARGLMKESPSRIYVLYKHILLVFNDYIYNPVATCLRFVQLVVLFGPVIVSLPMVLFGPITVHDFLSENVGDLVFKSKDRLGAVIWYKYLTWTMELAGPSFIKVCATNKLYYNLSWASFVVISAYLCAPFIFLFSVN